METDGSSKVRPVLSDELSRSPLPGLTVSITRSDDTYHRLGRTDGEGVFAPGQLEDGEYTVESVTWTEKTRGHSN